MCHTHLFFFLIQNENGDKEMDLGEAQESQDLHNLGGDDLSQLLQQVQHPGYQVQSTESDSPPSTPSTPGVNVVPPLTQEQTTSATKKRGRSEAPLFQRKQKQAKTEDVALGILSALVGKQAEEEAKENENTHFARYISTQLAKLPQKGQRQARRKIVELVDDILDEWENANWKMAMPNVCSMCVCVCSSLFPPGPMFFPKVVTSVIKWNLTCKGMCSLLNVVYQVGSKHFNIQSSFSCASLSFTVFTHFNMTNE